MPRERSPNRDKAFEIWKEHNGDIANRKIAEMLNVSEKTLAGWKVKDKWNEKLNGVLQTNERSTPKKKSRKTVGNKGKRKNPVLPNSTTFKTKPRGGPVGNKKAETHGFFSKYLPQETFEIIQQIELKNPLDIIWENINIQYAAIIRAQNLMFVNDQQDMTKELKKTKETYSKSSSSTEEEFEIQFAWDKHATFLNAQSRAMSELRSQIKQYDEMLHNNWELATEEQKARIEALKNKIVSNDSQEDKVANYLNVLEEVMKDDE
jgi:uncharacterized protein YjcR